MRRMRGVALLVAVIVLCAMATGCTEIQNPANAPFAYNEYQGKNYEHIVAELETAGFQNIKTETMLTFSESKEYTVGSVTIDGNHTFRKGTVYEATVPVVVSYYKMQEQEDPDDTSLPTEGTTATTEPTAENTQPESISQTEMIGLIGQTLTPFIGENYTVEVIGAVYTVNLWNDGLAMNATLAKAGNEDALEVWEELRETATDLSVSLYNLMEANGHGNETAMVNILNDIDKEKVLLSAYMGFVSYDYVTE